MVGGTDYLVCIKKYERNKIVLEDRLEKVSNF